MLILWLRLLGESYPSIRVRMALDVAGRRLFSQNYDDEMVRSNYLNLSMRRIAARLPAPCPIEALGLPSGGRPGGRHLGYLPTRR